jgi:hypothetical protein
VQNALRLRRRPSRLGNETGVRVRGSFITTVIISSQEQGGKANKKEEREK